MKDMVWCGYCIELYFYFYWIDVKYNGDGMWDYIDYIYYSLYLLDEDVRLRMFRDGIIYFIKLVREVDFDYMICVFRVGGWII